jgi:TonB family protein
VIYFVLPAGADKQASTLRRQHPMRIRSGFSLFAIAITASAAAHALLVASFSVVRVGGGDVPRQVAEMTVVFDDPAEAEKRLPHEFDIGRPDAKGYGTHATDGMREQVAREAPQDQPSLSLDPVGFSRNVDVPSAPDVPVPPTSAPEPAAPVAATPPMLPPVPAVALLDPTNVEIQERMRNEAAGAAVVSPPVLEVQPDHQVPPSPPVAVVPAPQRGTGADPAPQSDSEVDAFSVLGSADFRAGKVTVRAGRQVKTRRPKIKLAGLIDLSESATPQVVLKVAVDATGKVTDVDVIKSSGSNEIDQPCRVAMYDWWFEPKKDAAGHAVPDVFQFTISFR